MNIKIPDDSGDHKGYPKISPDAQFTPWDFAHIIAHMPDGCPLVVILDASALKGGCIWLRVV
jgi:hypothetical protein